MGCMKDPRNCRIRMVNSLLIIFNHFTGHKTIPLCRKRDFLKSIRVFAFAAFSVLAGFAAPGAIQPVLASQVSAAAASVGQDVAPAPAKPAKAAAPKAKPAAA